MKPKSLRTIAAVCAIGLGATACSGGTDPEGKDPEKRRLPEDLTLAAALQRFDTCDDLLGWIVGEARHRVTAYGLSGSGPVYPMMEERAMGEDAGADMATGGAPASTVPAQKVAGEDYSTTNVQVAGVDEPDVVKTDGDRILAVAGGRLHLVDVSGDEPRLADTLELPGGWGSEIVFAGDTALILGQGPWDVMPMLREGSEMATILPPGQPGSTITEVDLSGGDLELVDTIAIEGSYLSARTVDGVARIVLRSDPQTRLGFVAPSYPGPAAEDRAEEVNRQVIDESTVDEWLPAYALTDSKGEVVEEGRLVECEDTHHPAVFAGFGLLTVLTVDLSEGLRAGVEERNSAAVMAGGETMYASPEHLYVATAEYVDWEALDEQDRTRVDREYGTEIHRFDISQPDETTYEVSGRVEGHLLNQFSLDEHEGVLRVATTKGSPWSEGADRSESQVVTLAERDGALATAGSVGGLGQGESIQSVRFLGDLGYVVTYRQTDPLYTIDLSDPADPRVVGELKILGYSAYLHPLADGYLLGVGVDATEEGQRLGFQISLFDVRDPAAPKRVAQAAVANASSDTEWDHRAFLWWAQANLAVVPLNSWSESDQFVGAVGFGVDISGGSISERGRITHQEQGVNPPEYPDGPPDVVVDATDAAEAEDRIAASEPYYFNPQITRSLVIGDTLWTLSEAGLLASDLDTLAPGTWIAFPAPQ